MIPAIRNLIDQANDAIENGDGENHDHRVPIPPSQLAALSELRRKDYNQRAREELNSRLTQMLEGEGRAELEEMDVQRQYGLPKGAACLDIWGLIFEHVDDVEDIANLRDTCVLFREILERKYKTLRFIQVASKFANKFGGWNSLLNLRRVCKSSNAVVEQLLSADRLYVLSSLEPFCFDPYLHENWVKKGNVCFRPQDPLIQGIVGSLQSRQFPANQFPAKSISLTELSVADENLLAQDPQGVQNNPNPFVPLLRTQFQSFLDLAGNCVRYFDWFSVMDCLGAYNQLRTWMPLMPHLEELVVTVLGEPINPGGIQLPELDPFPVCPRLKRFENSPLGFTAPFIAQIFQANPGVSDVFISHLSVAGRDDIRELDISAIIGTLDTLKLEKFKLLGMRAVPPQEFLEIRPTWHLKNLSLLFMDQNVEGRVIYSRTLFAFINSFSQTLDEVAVNWEIHDNGGFLDLPKVSILCWKFWQNFKTLDFIIALGNLQYLDIDIAECRNKLELVVGVINQNNWYPIFPALKRMRARVQAQGRWVPIWES